MYLSKLSVCNESQQHLRLLWILLSSADKPIFIGLSVAGESVYLRVWPQWAFVVDVAAADGPDAPGVHRLTAVFYLGHSGEDLGGGGGGG